MGLDPTTFSDAYRMARYHLEAGLNEFKTWSKQMIEDLGEEVKPHLKDLWESAHQAIPLNKLFDRSAVLVSPEGKLMSIDEYDPRAESPQHPELLRKSGYKGDMTKFLKEGGVRAFTTGPEEAGVEVQNDSPAQVLAAPSAADLKPSVELKVPLPTDLTVLGKVHRMGLKLRSAKLVPMNKLRTLWLST